WLYAKPDAEARNELKRMILDRYDDALDAWRRLIDRDGSNSVSWEEFQAACSKIHFTGNISGAWRALDADLSGHITLQEFDPTSHSLLASFKAWADKNFGSSDLMLKALDVDGSGCLELNELKRACRKGNWRGDVLMLFNYLDKDRCRSGGKRSISAAELCFLDVWNPLDDDSLEEPHADLGHQIQEAETSLPALLVQPRRARPARPAMKDLKKYASAPVLPHLALRQPPSRILVRLLNSYAQGEGR
ncbi:unnamed protein product, partial [Polarella glacialis]